MNRTNVLRRKPINYYLMVFIIGVITATVIFIPFLIKDDGLFLYYGDFNVQQIPFYRLAHDAASNNNFPWSWNTDLGANFVGSYSFYLLGSPFFWITKLFPSGAVPYLMAPLLILKFSLTCVTGFAFINRFTKKSSSALIGALLYAFSGFNIYNIFFNHFNEVVLIFPLLLIALEELVINNQRGGFALAVALCAVTNYYFFFGQVIFVIIYFLIRCTSKDFNINFKKFLIICLEAVMGLLLSAILLLPSILAIIKNTRLDERLMGYDMLFYNDEQRYGLIFSSLLFPPDVPAKANFFENSNAKWSSVSAFLPLFSISGVVAFVKGKKKHWANKLTFACLIISLVPILNSAFSAFNYSYYGRWFYMPILIMAMMTSIAIESDIKYFKFGLKINAILVAAFLFVGIIPKGEDGKISWFSLPKDKEMFWGFAIIAVLGLLTCLIFCIYPKVYKKIQKVSVFCLVGIIIIYGISEIAIGKSLAGYDYYDEVAVKALHGRENVKLDDDDFYRIDTYDELDNLGMHWNMETINAFHSIVPTSVTEYYEAIGGERGVASRPSPSLIGVRGLTSVKYSFIMASSENKNLLPGFKHFENQNGYKIYKNEHFVPMGVMFDKFLEPNETEKKDGSSLDKILLKGLLLSNDDYKNYKNLLPTVNEDELSQLDDEDYFSDCDKLAKNAVSSFKYDGNGFTAKVDAKKDNFVFFSVPYDEGFTAKVNGKKAEIMKANVGFMAVKVPKGESDIEFKYTTPGLKAGIIVTIFSALIFGGYISLIILLRKKEKIKSYKKYGHLLSENCEIEIAASEGYIEFVSKTKNE